MTVESEGAKRARVALFLPSAAVGGAERVTLNLARGILDVGHGVDLVLASGSGSYLEDVPTGARVIDLRKGRTVSALPALARYLRSEAPTALLSALNHANVVAFAAARLGGFRGAILLAEHNELGTPDQEGLSGRIVRAGMRWAYPRSTRVIAVSQGVKDCVVKWVGVAPEQVEVIYNPVILPEHQRAAGAPVDHPFFAAGAPPVVLAVGRLTRLKNFALLLRAFARVLRGRDARLIVLGEGEERSGLEALARRLGIAESVALLGYVANPHAFMAKAAVLALSSDSEGLPTVLIEALASGTPVVATDCPTGPREILDGGRLGRLVPVGDEVALAEAIETTLDVPTPAADPRDLERFTVPVATAAYLRAMGL